MLAPLAAQALDGKTPQFVIEQRRQVAPRSRVALLPFAQKLRDLRYARPGRTLCHSMLRARRREC
jgi:hypothetical protein